VAAIFAGMLISTAAADVMIKQKDHTDAFEIMGQAQPAKDMVSVIWLGDGAARMDQADTTSWLMFSGSDVIYQLNHKEKTYSEFRPEDEKKGMPDLKGDDVDKSSRMGDMMKQMAGMMKIEVTVSPTDETMKIGDYNCKKYIVESKMGMGGSSAETWATQDIDIDYKLYRSISKAFMSMIPGYAESTKEMQKIKGLPVLTNTTTNTLGTEVKSTSELIEYKKEAAPPGTFQIPEGYTKTIH